MKDDLLQCTRTFQLSDDVQQRTRAIQDSMVESSGEGFSDAERGDLSVVIRLTVEFHAFLQLACAHRFCLEYACGSIFSGIEWYRNLTHAYRVLVGATESKVKGGDLSNRSIKEQFAPMFDAFDREENFEKKCRLLLDLFKLQIIFAGISYD